MTAIAVEPLRRSGRHPRPRNQRPMLIRRLRDDAGSMVTYLPPTQLMALVQISATTLRRWTKTGNVRVTDRLAGGRNYSVADAARLKRMTVKESQAEGIKRTPAELLRYQLGWYTSEQYKTMKTARNRNERWSDYDIQALVDAVEAGDSIEAMATKLGRTYAGVACMVENLRRAGDLPPAPCGTGDWWEQARELLTSDEIAALEGEATAA